MKLNKDFYQNIFSLVLPIAFSQFMLTLVSASDAFMLGKLTQNSMSAVSLAGQIAFIHNLFISSLVAGASMFAAQYWGKHDLPAIEQIFAITLRVSVTIGALFTVFTYIAPAFFMRILTNDNELVRLGSEYLKSVSPSYLLCGISQIYLCIMKNTERVKRSTFISSTAVVVNILLNAILIFGCFRLPAFGIQGAAYATVLARILECIMVMIPSRTSTRIRLSLAFLLRPDKSLGKVIWKHTLPVLGNNLAWGLGFSMSSVIIGHLGTDAVAANSIASIVRNLLACFCIGIGAGGGILVGNKLGAGQAKEGMALGRQLTIFAIKGGAISGFLSVLLIPAVLTLTDLTPRADHNLTWMLILSSIWMIGKAINCTTIGGIFRAGGDSRFGLICDTVTLWGIVIPLGLIAAFYWKLPIPAVYFIVNMDELIKLPLVYLHYKKYAWVKDLTHITA